METLKRMMQPRDTSRKRTTALTWMGQIVAAALICVSAGCQPHTVMSVPADDPEMNRSMERARAEVDTFIARLEKPTPGDRNFALKAPVKDGDNVEHFWLNDVRYRDGFFEGTIGNDPAHVKNVKFGDSCRVARSEISDWMFVENDRLVGGYTIHVMLDRLDVEERKAMLASLDFKVE